MTTPDIILCIIIQAAICVAIWSAAAHHTRCSLRRRRREFHARQILSRL